MTGIDLRTIVSEVKQKTILIVEDDVVTAMFEKKNLEIEGYTVIHTTRGDKAIEIVSKQKDSLDLILMDIELGDGIDGAETAQLILKNYDIPILFLTSHSEKEIVGKIKEIASYGYVMKNSGMIVLLTSIEIAFRLHNTSKKNNNQKIEIEANYKKIQDTNKNLIDVQQELLKNEIMLHRSEENYRLLFSEMLEGFALHEIICDKNGNAIDYRFIDVNPAFEKLTNLKRIEIIGKSVLEVMPKTELFWIEKFGEVAHTGESTSFENYSTVLKRNYQVTAFSPKKGQFAVLFSDITEHKLIESELKKIKMLLQSSLESPKDIIILSIDQNYKYLYFNTTHKNIMKQIYDADIEIGMSVLDYITVDMDKENAKQSYDVALSGKPYTTIQEYGDKEFYYFESFYNPIYNDANEIFGIAVFARNITERKLAEEKIKSLLAEKELILKEVHHRIKNNMSTMVSLLRLQSNDNVNPEASSILKIATSRLETMMVLYDKLYVSEKVSEISIKDYIPSLIDEILKIFPQKVDVEIQIEDIVLGTKLLSPLGIILNELITNSMKYAFNGKDGVIKIDTIRMGDHISLTYQDNGVGLPESVSLKESPGFGMQLIDILVKQINGSIVFERNNGTKCVVEFNA